MSFKNIHFDDSPVMRELERMAIKNGTFKSPSLNEMIKTASLPKSKGLLPSQDLHIDIVNLAVALRKKGLNKEAASLEDKIFLHKQAETHLYRAIDEDAEDILNFAHPDGAHRVSDAQDARGDVDTLLTKHQKILQVINKKPTGKYAKLVDNIILATAEILDVNLTKLAQNKGLSDEEAAEMQLSPEIKKKRDEINAKIKTSISEIAPWVDTALGVLGTNETPPEWINFNHILDNVGVDYLSKKSGIDKNFILDLLSLWRRFYGNIMTPTVNSNVWKISGFGSHLSDEEANELKKYLPAAAGEIDQLKNATLSDPVSAQESLNQIVYNTIMAKRKVLSDKIVLALANANKDFAPLRVSLTGIKASLEQLSTLNIRRAVSGILPAWEAFKNNVADLQKLFKGSTSIFTELGSKEAYQAYQDLAQAIAPIVTKTSEVYSFITSSKLDDKLDNVFPEQVKKATSIFAKISTTLNNFINNPGNASKKEIENATQNLEISKGIWQALNKNENMPFGYIRAYLPEQVQNTIASIDNLMSMAERGLTMTSKYETPKQASLKQALISTGQWVGDKPATTPGAPVASKSPQIKNPARSNSGLQKLDASKPDRVAVANMQLALNNLGRGISIPENKSKFPKLSDYKPTDGLTIIGTGPKSNPHLNMFDGVWGPSTETAIELANKYLGSLGLSLRTGQRWDYGTKNHKPDTEEAAKLNSDSINRVNAMLGTLSSGAINSYGPGTVFDKVPPTISDDTVTSDETLGATIPVTGKDLSDLSSLFTFLERNNIMVKAPVSGQKTSDEIGLTYGEWSYLIYWLRGRARYQYDKASDKPLKREYFNMVSTLANRLYNIGHQMGIKDTFSGNVVVPTTMLTSGTPVPGQADRGQHGNNSRFNLVEDNNKGRQGNQFQVGLDGTRTPRTNTQSPQDDTAPPISDVIDLRRDYFDLPYEDLEISPVLRLADFQRVPGARMAQGLFGGNTIQYAQFLNTLWQQIKSAFAKWSRDASTDEVTNVQNYYNGWQQGLARQYRDITQHRRP